jgi:hypothetical protein
MTRLQPPTSSLPSATRRWSITRHTGMNFAEERILCHREYKPQPPINVQSHRSRGSMVVE